MCDFKHAMCCRIMADMNERTIYQQLRQLETIIKRLVADIDLQQVTTAGHKSLAALLRSSRAAVERLKDYELSVAEEDLRMQAKTLPQAIKSLQKMRDDLLKASEYELVGAVDVAQISAELEELVDKLH